MTHDQVKDAVEAAGGKPFIIRMADGNALRIPHTDHLITSEAGNRVAFFTPDGSLKLLDAAHITSIEFPLEGKRK